MPSGPRHGLTCVGAGPGQWVPGPAGGVPGSAAGLSGVTAFVGDGWWVVRAIGRWRGRPEGCPGRPAGRRLVGRFPGRRGPVERPRAVAVRCGATRPAGRYERRTAPRLPRGRLHRAGRATGPAAAGRITGPLTSDRRPGPVRACGRTWYGTWRRIRYGTCRRTRHQGRWPDPSGTTAGDPATDDSGGPDTDDGGRTRCGRPVGPPAAGVSRSPCRSCRSPPSTRRPAWCPAAPCC